MAGQGKSMKVEAEVQCRTCKGRTWVAWDYRHKGKDPKASGYGSARCGPCPAGRDMTDYTGRSRLVPS